MSVDASAAAPGRSPTTESPSQPSAKTTSAKRWACQNNFIVVSRVVCNSASILAVRGETSQNISRDASMQNDEALSPRAL